jgi:hypothetical protein
MAWRPLVIATCFALTMVGCAVDNDDDGAAPDVTIRNEQPAPPADEPDVHIGVEHKDTDVDIDARTAPNPNDADTTPNDQPR